MSRNHCYSALILRSRQSGESNRDVWLLTAEEGLLRATVFGGPKSRLRAYASPFHSGQAWVYSDPAKDSCKLTDFDVKSWRPQLRELYERAMAADAVADTVLSSHGGGEGRLRALALAEETLDALTAADGAGCSRILLHFFWRWIDFLGLMPDFGCCSLCGKSAAPADMLWYLPAESGAVCSGCRDDRHGVYSLEAGPGCRNWLERVLPLPPEQLARYTLDGKSFSETKSLAAAILAEALGKKLASWEWQALAP